MKFSNQKCIKVFPRLLSQPKNSQILLYVQNLIFFSQYHLQNIVLFWHFCLISPCFFTKHHDKDAKLKLPKEVMSFLKKKIDNTVKLGDKERFAKEQIDIKEPFPVTKCQFTS